MRAFLRRLTANAAEADDLAQDAFVKAYRAHASLASTEAARTWLFRIAYRTFLDARRRSDRREALMPAQDETPPAPAPGLRMDVEAALAHLPPDRRACVMLGLGLGHSHREVAEITGLPLGTVKSHIDRARTFLRGELSAYEVTP